MRRHGLVLGLVAAGVLSTTVAGCAKADHGGLTDVTLPSSLSVTSTVPGVPAPTTTTSPSGVPPTNPTADGAPVIRSLVAEPGAATCTGGAIPAVISFEVDPQPPVRVVTVFLDASTTAAAAANSATSLTIPAVPCDGSVHQVLFIATGTNGQSSTQAVAFRSPGAS